MSLEVVLPILIPLTAGALSLALWRSVQLQRLVAVVATALLLVASIWLLRSTIDKGFLGGGFILPVAGHDLRAANANLALLAKRHGFFGTVQGSNFDLGTRQGATDRAFLVLALIVKRYISCKR